MFSPVLLACAWAAWLTRPPAQTLTESPGPGEPPVTWAQTALWRAGEWGQEDAVPSALGAEAGT